MYYNKYFFKKGKKLVVLKNIKYKYTYGEAQIKNKDGLKLWNGDLIDFCQSHKIAPKMNRHDASIYYCKKLADYWRERNRKLEAAAETRRDIAVNSKGFRYKIKRKVI